MSNPRQLIIAAPDVERAFVTALTAYGIPVTVRDTGDVTSSAQVDNWPHKTLKICQPSL